MFLFLLLDSSNFLFIIYYIENNNIKKQRYLYKFNNFKRYILKKRGGIKWL